MSVVNVSVEDFRAAFPEFSDETKYPTQYITRFLTQAQLYISNQNYRIKPEVRILAIEYMTGHLITLAAQDGAGNANAGADTAGSTIIGSTVDNVSVSLQAPMAKNAFEQWVQTTPYGKQYWALMVANNPVGVYWCGTRRAFGIR